MALRVRVVTIEGEGPDVASAITSAFGGAPAVVEALPPVTTRHALPVATKRGRVGKWDDKVLGALKFRPATLGEIATAVAGRKDNPVALQTRIWPVLARMVKAGVLVRTGKTYAKAA